MTETETEPRLIRRQYLAPLARAGADERTLGGCCVPYNAPTLVSDDGIHAYSEMFAPGAFGRQVAAATRIPLRYRHGEGLLDTVGRATELDDRPDGLHGLFRVFAGVIGDQALMLVDEGLLPGLSVSGVPTRSRRNADGVVVRERVHLTEVSLVEEPAYAGAVLSVRRSRVELELPERPSDEQLARLSRVGIVLNR